jgi:acetyl esterase/lipase
VTATAETTAPSTTPPPPANPHGRITVERVGSGARSAIIARPRGAREPLPAVVFLHGWEATDPTVYGAWIAHLVEEGEAVIYPAYQTHADSRPRDVLGNALAGVRAALAKVRIRPGSLVVAGHSAGGTLAAGYAAAAPALGLPPARAVFAVYPGRDVPGPSPIPQPDLGRIPADTMIEALAGAHDQVVGEAEARAIVEGAVRVPLGDRRLVVVTDPTVAGHEGPARTGAEARRAFWARLDALIAEVRGG